MKSAVHVSGFFHVSYISAHTEQGNKSSIAVMLMFVKIMCIGVY